MAKEVRVPKEWNVRVEARSTVKGTRSWSGVTVGFDIDDALEDVPEHVLMEDPAEEPGPDGHIVYMMFEVGLRG